MRTILPADIEPYGFTNMVASSIQDHFEEWAH